MDYTIQNRKQLNNLLTISNPTKVTIYDVIGRMEVLLDFFKQNKKYHGLIPFLLTYYLVTKAVVKNYITHKHLFYSVRDLELLDVYFASLYFKPLFAFLEKGILQTPWRTYFTYCQQSNGTPFVQVMLGINAHINTDLYSVLLELRYHNQKDFFLVNDILLEVIPDVMRFLAKERDIVGFGGVVLRNFITQEFHRVIEQWRSVAWVNMKATINSERQRRYEMIAKETEQVGEDIIEIFTDLYHLRGVSTILQKVNSLYVPLIV